MDDKNPVEQFERRLASNMSSSVERFSDAPFNIPGELSGYPRPAWSPAFPAPPSREEMGGFQEKMMRLQLNDPGFNDAINRGIEARFKKI